jgi:hypothetical protein
MTPATPKVVGATGGSVAGSALSILVLYLLGQYAHFNPPPEVAGAITLLVSGVTTYVGGYLSPHEAAAGGPS